MFVFEKSAIVDSRIQIGKIVTQTEYVYKYAKEAGFGKS